MTRLALVGGGRMGEALLGGLLAGGWAEPADLVVVEPVAIRRDELADRYPGVGVSEPAGGRRGRGGGGQARPGRGGLCAPGRLAVGRVLSIAAGVTLARLEAALAPATPVVRAMPNTPALVGAGAAAIAGGTHASADDLDWAEGMLGAVGMVVRVDEPLLDAVTGLSGSGPAYVFLVAEALIEARRAGRAAPRHGRRAHRGHPAGIGPAARPRPVTTPRRCGPR